MAETMLEALEEKVEQYRKDNRNLFSYSEKIVVALRHPDLYQDLMPKRYQDKPMAAYYRELAGAQQQAVIVRWA